MNKECVSKETGIGATQQCNSAFMQMIKVCVSKGRVIGATQQCNNTCIQMIKVCRQATHQNHIHPPNNTTIHTLLSDDNRVVCG